VKKKTTAKRGGGGVSPVNVQNVKMGCPVRSQPDRRQRLGSLVRWGPTRGGEGRTGGSQSAKGDTEKRDPAARWGAWES